MKKLTLLIAILAIVASAKATVHDSLGFPDHVIARTINNAGEITMEYVSDFIYGTDGKLTDYIYNHSHGDCQAAFSFYKHPNMPTNSLFTFHYDDMTRDESYTFTYENDHIKRKVSQVDVSWRYVWDYYYDNHHLSREDYRSEVDHDLFRTRHLYSYENDYRTRVDQYYEEWDSLCLTTVTTNHYNNRLQVLTSQTDVYNDSGEASPRTLKTYIYTPQNKTDSIITQTYIDGTWVNSKIAHYVYDSKNRIVEYQTGSWSTDVSAWIITNKIIYDFNDEAQTLTISFRKKNDDGWEWDRFSTQSLFNDSRLYEWQRAFNLNFNNGTVNQFEISMHYDMVETVFPFWSEWYYNIIWNNGSITYQHLECTGDTTINNKRPKVIVRSNTHYDRDTITDVTHEFILEEGNKVYWWNKDLQEFTVLYDYNAEPGDEWEIKVGQESITVHVDDVDIFEYEGETYKRLYISDVGDIFNGEIVVGFGHMTSFFPEKLMNRGKGFRVDGLRCYWAEDALLYHNSDEDCDAIHSELHGIEEPTYDDATFAIYPNPANGVLFVETRHGTSLPDQSYRITNLLGQTVLSGNITAETQQINIASLSAGMYFITVVGKTQKFIVK